MAKQKKSERGPFTTEPRPTKSAAAKKVEAELRKTLRDNLERALRDEGISQRELAERSGLSQAVLSRIFSGRRRANTEQIAALATALQMPPMRLFMTSVLMSAREQGKASPSAAPYDPQDPTSHPYPPSLVDFLEKYRDRITPLETKMVVSVGGSMQVGKDVDEAFWLGLIKLYRDAGGSSI